MRRKTALILTAIIVLCATVFSLCACNKNDDSQECDNVSRKTCEYYAGESDKFAVSIEKGRRERAFIADGIATDVIDFCDVTIIPLKTTDAKTLSFTISAQDKTLSGEIEGSFGEFCASIQLDFVPTTVTVTAGEVVDEIDLSSVLEGALTADQVIDIAKQEFKDKIDAEYAQGKADREIYVKLITADRTTYYYYVSFIGDGVDYWAMLADVKTGEVISKK